MNISYLNNYSGIAIIDDSNEYTFLDLYRKIKYYEDEFNVYTNQTIAIIADFSFETISLLMALSSSNNTIVPIVYTTDEEVEKKVLISKVNIKIRFDKDKNISKEIINLNQDINYTNAGIILFSSGTTGDPKMMFHEYDKLFKILENPAKKQRSLKILLFLMFDHIGGINTLLNCLKDGSTIVIPSERTPHYIVDLIHRYGVNILPTTPTFLNLMLISDLDFYVKLKSLKLISYGTERMPDSILKKIKASFPGVKLLQTFGTSETGILKTISKSSDSLFFKIEDDRYEYKIVDSILYIKSNLNVSGYLNTENTKFDSEGWYNTGDIVESDNEGYLKIVGRINEVINVGGLKVMPNEVESILMQHEGIMDCLVFGQLNPITGQMVSTKIVVDKIYFNNLNDFEIKQDIKNHCKIKLDKYKIPAKIIFVEKLEYTNRFKKNLK
jgi:acyl-coenzyme A synthetase/AMP-(fatty) acid ligase